MTVRRIGISGRTAMVEGADRTGVNSAYVRAVAAVGAAPVILSPLAGVQAIPALLDGLHGLVLSGGPDIDPKHYGAAPHPKLGAVDAERDAFELALFAEARTRRLPTLAICRGMQLVNVAMGGTLWQDLPSEIGTHPQSTLRTDRAHRVDVTHNSMLAEVLEWYDFGVNSFHHQAIRDLAPGLQVSARSRDDGLIEAIEFEGYWPFLGVQWHPEEFWVEWDRPAAWDSCEFRLFRTLDMWARGRPL